MLTIIVVPTTTQKWIFHKAASVIYNLHTWSRDQPSAKILEIHPRRAVGIQDSSMTVILTNLMARKFHTTKTLIHLRCLKIQISLNIASLKSETLRDRILEQNSLKERPIIWKINPNDLIPRCLLFRRWRAISAMKSPIITCVSCLGGKRRGSEASRQWNLWRIQLKMKTTVIVMRPSFLKTRTMKMRSST